MLTTRPEGLVAGATTIEYALLAALVAVIVVAAITLLGGNIDAMFGDLARQLGGETN
jgi:pilus assembly protein Flp/PilA